LVVKHSLKRVTPQFLDDMLRRAADSPRRRTHHNLHETAADPVQRLVVATRRDAYFRVHRHPRKWELAMLLRGCLDVLVFDEQGLLTERIRLGADGDAVLELPPGTFHTLVPQADESVFFEVKQGPYDPNTAAEFADWAPAEGSAEAEEFAARLRVLEVGATIA
jgi:cupin fold WbuC family metalloprotein